MRAGLRTFDAIRSQYSYQLECICNRKAPFGDDILRQVRALPIYQIGGHQVLEGPAQVRAEFTVTLMNQSTMYELFYSRDKGPTAGRGHVIHLCISDSSDTVIFHRKVKDETLAAAPLTFPVIFSKSEKEPKNKYTISLLSESFIGIDVPQRSFDLHFAVLESNVHLKLFDDADNPFVQPSLPDEMSVAAHMAPDLGPGCSHKCRNKSLCLHDCCKTSAQAMKTLKENYPLQRKAATAKRLTKSVTGHKMVRKGINMSDAAEQRSQESDEPAVAAPSASEALLITSSHLPDPAPQLPLFPKPLHYTGSAANFRLSDVQLAPQQTVEQTREQTPDKRRAVFIEEDDDDDELEVVFSEQRFSPDAHLLTAQPVTPSYTSVIHDQDRHEPVYERVKRYASSPLKKYRPLSNRSPSPTPQRAELISCQPTEPQLSVRDRLQKYTAEPLYAEKKFRPLNGWSTTPQQPISCKSAEQVSTYDRLNRFVASPLSNLRPPSKFTVFTNIASQRGMDFRSNLMPAKLPLLTPRTAKERGMDFRNFDDEPTAKPFDHQIENVPSLPRHDRETAIVFDRSALSAQPVQGQVKEVASATPHAAGGDAPINMKSYDEIYDQMMSEINDPEMDLLIKQLMQDD